MLLEVFRVVREHVRIQNPYMEATPAKVNIRKRGNATNGIVHVTVSGVIGVHTENVPEPVVVKAVRRETDHAPILHANGEVRHVPENPQK
jgi:hypothetical protein